MSGRGVVLGAAMLVACAAGLLAPAGARGSDEPDSGSAPPAALTVVVDLLAEDARGVPVQDLRVEELDVVQDATKQPVKTMTRQGAPGRYELRYVPLSGKPGGVTVSVTRRGVRLKGADGPFLKPRLVQPLPPLEAELLALLESRPEARDLDCEIGVLRFHARPEGIHHLFAVDLPLPQLRGEGSAPAVRLTGLSAAPAGVVRMGARRLQILVRVRSADGGFNRHLTYDREVDTFSGLHLVWSSGLTLPEGRYAADFVLRDRTDGRATVRHVDVDAPPAAGGLRVSSLVFLDAQSVARRTEGEDDPFVFDGTPLMPTLRPVMIAGENATASFFAVIFPGTAEAAPVSLTVEVLRDGSRVAEVPMPLPKREPGGEYRFVGGLPTKTLLARPYTVRLIARQGQATASEQAVLTMRPALPATGE